MRRIFDYESDEEAVDNYLDCYNNSKEGLSEKVEILQLKKAIKAAEGYPLVNEERKSKALKKKEKFFKPID